MKPIPRNKGQKQQEILTDCPEEVWIKILQKLRELAEIESEYFKTIRHAK